MTKDELRTAIRSLEGKAKVALDHARFHDERGKYHLRRADEASVKARGYLTAIDALQESHGEREASR